MADTPVISDERAFETYRRVRDAVARMKGRAPAAGTSIPSAYWTEELENIDFMADASPIIIRKLRHHAFWITGLRAYDYRIQDDERRRLFEERLRALAALGGSDLLIPEPETLAGFGYRIDGGLYNLDTLKFFEVLVGMRIAGILDPLRSPAQAGHYARTDGGQTDVVSGVSRTEQTDVVSGFSRTVIVEIGGGWGGLAYQLKTLIPGATYVIVDLPELFLFSAVYLQSVFPDAMLAFWGGNENVDWRGADFVFVPNTHADAIAGMAPQLLVNTASFQEMTTAQVDGYARIAAAARCPAIYSLNRERSRYNTELTSVSEVLGQYYDLRPITVLDTDYTKAMKKPSRKKEAAAQVVAKTAADDDLSYRHLAGSLKTVDSGRWTVDGRQ